MKLFWSGLLALGLTSGVYAQSSVVNSSETTLGGVMQTIKDAGIGAGLDTESYVERLDSKPQVNNVHTNLYPQLNYTISDKQVLRLYPLLIVDREKRLSYGATRKDGYSIKDDYLALRYDHAGLLNSNDHGVDLSLSSRVYARVSEGARLRNHDDGVFNPRIYVSKEFSDRFSLDNETRFYFHNVDNRRIDQSKSPTGKWYEHHIYLTPKYRLVDRLTAQIEFLNYSATARMGSEDWFRFRPGFHWSATDKLGVDLFSETMTGNQFGKGPHLSTYSKDDTQLYTNIQYAFNPDFKTVVELSAGLLKNGKLDNRNLSETFTAEVDFMIKAF